MQSTTAAQIAVDPTLLVAANTAGGVMGKIVSPQSIAIAAAAVNSAGEESKITSMSIKYSAILLSGLRLVLRPLAHGWLKPFVSLTPGQIAA